MILSFYNQTAETSIFSEICLLGEFSRQKDYFAGEIEMMKWYIDGPPKHTFSSFPSQPLLKICQSNSSIYIYICTQLLLQILCIFRFLLTKATSLECIWSGSLRPEAIHSPMIDWRSTMQRFSRRPSCGPTMPFFY